MVSSDFAQIMSLHAGEAYAVQNLTRTDRLALLLSGKVILQFFSEYNELNHPFQVNVLSDNQFLHPILPCEFLDSPEFESSRNTVDDKFKVSCVLVEIINMLKLLLELLTNSFNCNENTCLISMNCSCLRFKLNFHKKIANFKRESVKSG